jgi:hypothetical protein
MAAASDRLIAEVGPYSKSGPARLHSMGRALLRVDDYGVPGDIVECGVWRAGNIILARRLCPTRVCWLYDTFDGMTQPGKFDVKPSGKRAIDSFQRKADRNGKWAAVSIDEVRANLAETATLDDRFLRFVQGPVETTLLDETKLPHSIAVLRLDTDWHASTKIELEVLYPRLMPGGYLIVDDYGHWLGARKAVDEYFGDAMPKLKRVDYSCVMMSKPC